MTRIVAHFVCRAIEFLVAFAAIQAALSLAAWASA